MICMVFKAIGCKCFIFQANQLWKPLNEAELTQHMGVGHQVRVPMYIHQLNSFAVGDGYCSARLR